MGQMTLRTAGREALIAPYPRTPAKPAPQGTDKAPLPPAQITCWGREAATGGWGGARPRARRGAGGRARSTGSTGVGPREPGGARSLSWGISRTRRNERSSAANIGPLVAYLGLDMA